MNISDSEALERELHTAPHIDDGCQQLQAPYPPPAPDVDVQDVAERAIAALATQRGMVWLGDGPIQVHLIASLICDLQFRLDEAIVLAANQHVAIDDLAHLAGLTVADTRQTITNLDPEHDLAN